MRIIVALLLMSGTAMAQVQNRPIRTRWAARLDALSPTPVATPRSMTRWAATPGDRSPVAAPPRRPDGSADRHDQKEQVTGMLWLAPFAAFAKTV